MSLLKQETISISDNFPEATGEAGLRDIWNASQDNTMTLTESWFQNEARETASKIGKKLTAEEANKRFPGLGADREVSEGEAQYLYDWKKERADRQSIIDSASGSFLKGTAWPFIASMGDSLTDPAEVAIGLLTGGIGNGLAKGAGLGKKLLIDSAEGMLSQAIAETPIMYETNESFETYTSKQFAKNALLGGIIQGGINFGASVAYRGSAKALTFAGEKTTENLIKLQKSLESKGINSAPVLDKIIKKIDDTYVNSTPILKESINTKFPELLEEGMDTPDLMLKKVFKEFEDGNISEEMMEDFVQDAFDRGVDPEVMALAVDDSAMQFSDEFIEEIKETAMDEKNRTGFTDKYDKELDEIEVRPAEQIDKDIAENYRATIENLPEEDLELDIEMDDGRVIKLKDLDSEVKAKQDEQMALTEYAACLRGVE
jgi:hypothetical protein